MELHELHVHQFGAGAVRCGMAVAGGFPGGWAGRAVFRHKTLHTSFPVVLVIATILNAAFRQGSAGRPQTRGVVWQKNSHSHAKQAAWCAVSR